MKNPKWHRDEIILTLDLYFDTNRGPIDARNPRVIELSHRLNALPIFVNRPDEEKFRNPNGVGLKLSNFLAIDPNHSGKGMQSYSKLDAEIFNEFKDDRALLHQLALEILSVSADPVLSSAVAKVEDDENSELDRVPEGQVLYKLHKVRERNPKIVKAKKDQVFKKSGGLACEACGFDFARIYGALGEAFIECHHLVPLASIADSRVTHLDDLALVCSNCHRMFHRDLSLNSVEMFRKMVSVEYLTLMRGIVAV